MGIKIYGSASSCATLRVVAAAHEKEVDFEFVHVDMTSGAHKQHPYLSLNVSLSPYCHQLIVINPFSLFNPSSTDMTIVEENEAKLAKVLDVYEARLGVSKYLGGETFTLADLHHLPQLHILMDTQVKKVFDERSHFSAWCKDILARPAWEKTMALLNQA
ncbi:glutathione S-transferase PARB-like [Spinacia oleracea]|uniref:glutathione transferase n=1 Tax=Spinacia oleracea TaxID=3562 RepID=A0ABM3RHA1_SPIOL|nr:glutathione S-transferase PARB-like [Spinacia oleracea]